MRVFLSGLQAAIEATTADRGGASITRGERGSTTSVARALVSVAGVCLAFAVLCLLLSKCTGPYELLVNHVLGWVDPVTFVLHQVRRLVEWANPSLIPRENKCWAMYQEASDLLELRDDDDPSTIPTTTMKISGGAAERLLGDEFYRLCARLSSGLQLFVEHFEPRANGLSPRLADCEAALLVMLAESLNEFSHEWSSVLSARPLQLGDARRVTLHARLTSHYVPEFIENIELLAAMPLHKWQRLWAADWVSSRRLGTGADFIRTAALPSTISYLTLPQNGWNLSSAIVRQIQAKACAVLQSGEDDMGYSSSMSFAIENSSSIRVQEACTKGLARVTINPEFRYFVTQQLETLIPLMRRTTDLRLGGVDEAGVGASGRGALGGKNAEWARNKAAGRGSLPTTLSVHTVGVNDDADATDSTDGVTLVSLGHACAALANLAVDGHRGAILSAGGIPVLLSKMGEHRHAVMIQSHGCRALRYLASSPAIRQAIVAGGGLGRLVSAIETHPGSYDVQEHGCGAMMNLAGLTESKVLQHHGCRSLARSAADEAFEPSGSWGKFVREGGLNRVASQELGTDPMHVVVIYGVLAAMATPPSAAAPATLPPFGFRQRASYTAVDMALQEAALSALLELSHGPHASVDLKVKRADASATNHYLLSDV